MYWQYGWNSSFLIISAVKNNSWQLLFTIDMSDFMDVLEQNFH